MCNLGDAAMLNSILNQISNLPNVPGPKLGELHKLHGDWHMLCFSNTRDLSYITDRVIVMGYPASGVEGLYRNRREDAKKFLEHHHGRNFWVFNFCPVKENSYSPSVFDGRVSRYPFPDHQ